MADPVSADGNNQGGVQATQPTTNTPSAPAPGNEDAAALRAELARKDAELTKVRAEAASHCVKGNEARSAADKAAEANGEFKALAESRAARIAELEGHAPHAQKWREHEERETARITTVRASLEPHWQAALDAAPSLEGKQAVLTAIEAARGTQKPPPGKPPVQGGAPGAPAATDWNEVIHDQAALRAAKARDPVGFANFLATHDGSADRKPTTHELMQARRTAKAARKPGV